MTRIVSWVALVLLLWAVPSIAVNRYVNGNTGNDSGGCTNSGSPCRTIAYGIEQTGSGDVLTVRGGTGGSCIIYQETSKLVPKSNTTIQVQGGGHLQGGECATVRPAGIWGLDEIWNMDNRSFVTIEGFKIDGSDGSPDITTTTSKKHVNAIYAGTDDNTHDNVIRYNEMLRTNGNCVYNHGGTALTFEGNVIHHCGYFTCNSFGQVDGPTGEVSTGDSHGMYFGAHNSIIRGNTFHHNPAYSIQIYGGENMDNNLVENNIFSTSRSGVTMKGTGNIFRNNVMHDDGHNEELGPQWSGEACTGNRTDVGVLIDGGGQKHLNNTMYGHNIQELGGKCGSGCEIKNNIVCNGGSIIKSGSGASSNNLTGSCPGFQGAGGGNFHLTANDNGGVTHANALVDFDGVSRGSAGSASDRGAFEYVTPGTPAATSLAFVIQPSATAPSAGIVPAPTVQVKDQSGVNFATVVSITMAIGANPGGSTLTGTTMQTTNASGLATFPGLSLNNAGTGYTLIASSPGLDNATSNPFNVTGTAPGLCTSACTVYVAPSGDDSRACNAATITNPRRTLAGGVACLTVPGSTLYLRAGTYVEALDTSTQPIAGGTDWTSPTTIAGYGTETVTIQRPATGAQATLFFRNATNDHYIVVDRLIVDANNYTDSNALVFYPGTHHLRFQNGEIRNVQYEAVLINDASDTEILNSSIHTNLTSEFLNPLIFIDGSSTRTIIRGNTLSDVRGAAVSATNGSIVTIERNRLNQVGATYNHCAIQVGGSGNSGSSILTNVLHTQACGIQLTSGANAVKVYANTIYNTQSNAIRVDSGSTNADLKNNLGSFTIGVPLLNNGTGTIQTTNQLAFDAAGFTNAAGGILTLNETATAAIDDGTVLSETAVDFLGITRSTYAPPDIGAYEFQGHEGTPPLPPGGGVFMTAPYWKSLYLNWR